MGLHIYEYSDDCLSLDFPLLKSFTLTGGTIKLKINCPLLQSLVFEHLDNLRFCEFSSLDFLETIQTDTTLVPFPSVLKNSITLREVTWKVVVDYYWPNIEYLSLQGQVSNSFINQLQSLKVLHLSGFK